eukprot:4155870-Amphidinium_carterae.1
MGCPIIGSSRRKEKELERQQKIQEKISQADELARGYAYIPCRSHERLQQPQLHVGARVQTSSRCVPVSDATPKSSRCRSCQ